MPLITPTTLLHPLHVFKTHISASHPHCAHIHKARTDCVHTHSAQFQRISVLWLRASDCATFVCVQGGNANFLQLLKRNSEVTLTLRLHLGHSCCCVWGGRRHSQQKKRTALSCACSLFSFSLSSRLCSALLVYDFLPFRLTYGSKWRDC